MKTKPLVLVILFLGIFFAASTAFGQVTITSSVPSGEYNVFLVADLGLQGAGGRNRIFQLNVNLPDGDSLSVVGRDGSGQQILNGTTDQFSSDVNETLWNYEIDDRFGGDFDVYDEGTTVDKILATGKVPAGTYTITISSVDTPAFSDTIIIIVKPPFLQPVFPVDVAIPDTALDFKYVARNFNSGLELSLFEDPSGRVEVTRGGVLPAPAAGGTVQGTAIAKVLEEGETYYWQLSGYITTTHGNELVKGPLSMFIYGEPFTVLGLSDEDKLAIKDKIIEILQQFVNRRAARSIADYVVDRGVLDNSVIGREEIMSILLLMEDGKFTINSISLQ